MSGLYWREPMWALIALLPLFWLGWHYWRTTQLKHRYADPQLWPWALGATSVSGRHWRRLALVMGWLLLALAAAGPRLPADPAALNERVQSELMIVLDLSRSMAAEDVWPNRRRVAMRTLRGVLPGLRAARVGLVVVGGHAHLLWPPSTDRQGLAELVAQLDQLRLPSHGSALAEGVTRATQAFTDTRIVRHLLIVSDGDLTANGLAAVDAALRAAPGVGLTLAGIGSTGGAALTADNGDWLQQDDQIVVSRLNLTGLTQLAAAHGGHYLSVSGDDPADDLRKALPISLQHLTLAGDTPLRWSELFPWLLLPALGLLVVGVLHLPAKVASVSVVTTALYVSGLGATLPAHADVLAQAHAALAADDARQARTLFDQADGFAARMGSGAACHRLQDWSCARQAFGQAVLRAPNDSRRADAIYNLAHSVFQTGDFAGSAALFGDALRYAPDHQSARHNREFAKALAAEVERLRGGPQAERRGRGRAASNSDAPAPADAARTLSDAQQSTAAQPDRSAADRQALINRGLAYTRLASRQAKDPARPWGHAFGASPDGDAPDISLWQTLIERAEGLPASPEQPLMLDGVRPW